MTPALLAAALAAATPAAAVAPDAAPWQAAFAPRPATFAVAKRSLYVPMKDGVRLALDVYLPQGSGAPARAPTLLVQTRYYRKSQTKADPAGSCAAIHSLARYFTARGYALVIADVRGTGASFGVREAELGPTEAADGAALLDWIAAQPWSTGKVAAFGQSYLGSAAELLAAQRHPALKAIAPVSSVYDAYADLYFPGGLLNMTFQAGWGALNRALDSGHPDTAPHLQASQSVCPVDGDADGRLRAAAIAEHARNFDSAAAAAGAQFRDDPGFDRGFPKPYDLQRAADLSGVPVLSLEGSMDTAYARSGVDRLINDRAGRQRLILAAGDHGAHNFYAPGVTGPVPSAFDQNAELLAFFDRYVDGRNNGYERSPRVRWFTTGANAWRSAEAWPVPSRTVSYRFERDRRLSPLAAIPAHEAVSLGDGQTGEHSRWETSIGGGAVFYAERSTIDAGLVSYTGTPLAAPLEVTGSPVVTLRATEPGGAGDWFVYLEQVEADGRAYIVGEGQLRASRANGAAPYRVVAPSGSGLRRDAGAAKPGAALRIGLIPFSHRFPAGARLRVTIAGSDRAHFQSPPAEGRRVSLALGRGGSTLDLPVVAAR